MTSVTPTEAATLLCPLARTFATQKAETGCRGPACMLWRWTPLPADLPEFVAAVAARKAGSDLAHKDAVAWVMANRAELGIPTKPTHGFCGAGGAA